MAKASRTPLPPIFWARSMSFRMRRASPFTRATPSSANPRLRLAIDKATGQWIGRVGLDELDDWPETGTIEVGWELHTAWWGKGLATEAGLAALRFGFGEHQLDRIISVTAPWNMAARRVMERIGLEEQGARQWNGLEVVWYALDRSAWQKQRKR